MGSWWPLALFLLFCKCVTGLTTGEIVLDGVPRTVWLEDNATPGTTVANFTVQCANSSLTASVIQKNISPMTSFFNQPNILSDGNYQVSLGPSAALDFRQVSLYILTYSAHCAGESDEFQLFIKVTPSDRLECGSRSADIGRVPLQVPEDITPGAFIYRPVLKRRGTRTLNFAIENASLPFQITPDGIVCAPPAGFSREQASKIFSVDIVVTSSDGKSCQIPLSVQVLPVYHNQVNFTESSVAKSVSENTGPLQEIIQVRASGENVLYQIISPSTNYFTVVPGVIKNTYNLDLKRNPSLAETQLLVKAYNKLHPNDYATIMVNITVKQKNLEGPLCSPAVFVTNIPETIPTGSTLLTLSCNDAENGNSSLWYQMEDAQSPLYSFQMEGPNLQVNTTLDYDSAVMASLSFQYQAAILVRDNGSPPRTTRVPVLVTVSPVNEYAPECLQRFFTVPENAGFGDIFGNASGTDRDYPFNNIEYSILGAEAGAPTLFYIGRNTGQLYVLGPLDYEEKKVYHLTISLKDLDNDANPHTQMTTLCNITINVQDVNDNSPVCDPPFYKRSIYSTQASTISVVQLTCTDKDERSELIYNIVGGNTNGRFRMDGNRLFPNTFSYNRDGIFDPLTFELLVQVTDSHSTPQFSTTAVILVHVIPWTTTVPTTTTTTTAVAKEPIILHKTKEYWAPDPWFVIVITLTGVLLLSTLGLLFWQFCWRVHTSTVWISGRPQERCPSPYCRTRLKDWKEITSWQKNQARRKGKDPLRCLVCHTSLMAVLKTLSQASITCLTAALEHGGGYECVLFHSKSCSLHAHKYGDEVR
ncbi:cadherin-related family member 4 isoform X2 [Sceloporus undulatus]|uniref:cadherin-related family member 4 isoform X2 n=1 Tax=Sceloporus undulatus TaxID=8520 RepID=UPI001C4C957E|nr:cadherin-related family member 4 isoform X2 [Sceloporus undulatus]